MFGGDSELLLLMTNPKLPGDTRSILVDPHFCLELEFADLIADTVQRQSHIATAHDWCEFNGEKHSTVAEAAKARFLAMPQFEATDVHVRMKGRGKDYKKTQMIFRRHLLFQSLSMFLSRQSKWVTATWYSLRKTIAMILMRRN